MTHEEKFDDYVDDAKRMQLIDKYYDGLIEHYRDFTSENHHSSAVTTKPAEFVVARSKQRVNLSTNSNADESSSETASNSDLGSFKSEIFEIDAILIEKNTLNSTSEEIVLGNVKLKHDDVLIQNANLNEQIPSTITNIEKIAIQSSNDIQIGNKTYINGPTTVIYLPSDKNKMVDKDGEDNNGFVGSHDFVNKIPTKLDSIDRDHRKKCSILTTASAVVVTLILLSIGTFLITQSHSGIISQKYTSKSDGDRPETPQHSTAGEDFVNGNVLNMIPRSKWLAQPPNKNLSTLDLPVSRVIIIHTATETCETPAICVYRVRHIQTFHIESYGFDDIGYNFLVGGDGAVYEGRGWDIQGAHTKGFNTGSIGIAYIGTFNNVLPSEKQLKAGNLIIEEGVKLGKLTKDYKIYAHRQLNGFESPGAKFYELIKTWVHWSKAID